MMSWEEERTKEFMSPFLQSSPSFRKEGRRMTDHECLPKRLQKNYSLLNNYFETVSSWLNNSHKSIHPISSFIDLCPSHTRSVFSRSKKIKEGRWTKNKRSFSSRDYVLFLIEQISPWWWYFLFPIGRGSHVISPVVSSSSSSLSCIQVWKNLWKPALWL